MYWLLMHLIFKALTIRSGPLPVWVCEVDVHQGISASEIIVVTLTKFVCRNVIRVRLGNNPAKVVHVARS